MLKVYSCIRDHHDLKLVLVALSICILGAFTTGILVQQVSRSRGGSRFGWHLTAALAAGLSIWATHFIGMLAFRLGLPHGYAVGPTLLSMLLAVGVTWLSMALALRARTIRGRAVAGSVLGLGIVAMHYTGMAAFRFAGHLIWDPRGVFASIVVAVGCGAAAVVCLYRGRLSRNLAAPAMFVLAILGGHFIGMSAMAILPDPTVAVSPRFVEDGWLVASLIEVSGMICVFSVAAIVIALRDQTRRRQELVRLRNLADVTVEALVVCDGDLILSNNHSFDILVGGARDAQKGLSIASFGVDPILFRQSGPTASFQTRLVSSTGERVPVEVIRKEIDYGGAVRRIYAIRDLSDQERAAAEMEFMANHDVLTGLANRLRFGVRLQRQFEVSEITGRGFALLALDLDRFKAVNDTFGHGMGDALLARVAKRLMVAVSGQDVVARLGGDEFAILLESSDDPNAVIRLADRVVDLLGRPFVIDGAVLEIGVSVGVALAPGDACDAERLKVCADLALYRAKDAGRGAYRLFEPEMDARMQERRTLEMDLRRATARREFELHYQPQLAMSSGAIIGFEALLRWRHPERGLIPPSEFIPVAEDIGLIGTIGEWVLRTACREAAGWDQPLSVAVNLSPLQCRSAKIVDVVITALEESGLAPQRLELEITEGVLLHDNVGTLAILNAMHELGVRISMDDFGTGYSSLSYLRSFPFDKIKIDRSFVSEAPTDKECASIIRAIVGLGASLGMSITAEGVETEEQMAFIRGEGCDEVQGFLISHPLAATEIDPFLKTLRLAAPLKQVQNG